MVAKGSGWSVTAAQTDVLCSFFEENPEVIAGYKKTSKCIEAVRSKWREITPQLNSLGGGRDHKAWAKYLCNIKAKLKRKKVKWHKSSDGTRPIIYCADDFNEIELRMLQVLRKNQNQLEEESDLNDVCVSDVETEANVRHNENSCDTDDNTWQESEKASNNVTFIKLLDSDSPLLETRQPTLQTVSDSDEFDTFGRNIAQQLRTLPIPVALETQEILLSVLRKQRLKFLHV